MDDGIQEERRKRQKKKKINTFVNRNCVQARKVYRTDIEFYLDRVVPI